MLSLCYVIRCISTNESEGEPLWCPTVPTTPSRPCEVVPTSRTLAYTETVPTKMLTLCYVIWCISTNECEGKPLRCPTVPTTPSRPCEDVPTSRTLADTEHIISKNRPQKCCFCAILPGAFPQMNARVNPYGVPRFQRHHPDHVRLCPVREHSRTRST